MISDRPVVAGVEEVADGEALLAHRDPDAQAGPAVRRNAAPLAAVGGVLCLAGVYVARRH